MQSQNDQILSYLKKGMSLTPLEALQFYGTMRLAARVYELKSKGWPIECERVQMGEVIVGRYSLPVNKDLWP